MKKRLYILGVLALILSSCAKAPQPILPIPEQKQVEWQKMETYAFIHFGPNTFLDREWGYGDADPKDFNPTELDCEQWVRTLKNAGMKGVILTAKHHDGFCLWPSRYTDYSVKQSPWKNGEGDVVKELSEACKKYGIKFAVYLSPWDRHQSFYGTPEYVDYFHNQLRELLSNYGPTFEVWFDGAMGGDGWYGGANDNRTIDRKNYYNYPKIYEILNELQPQAIVFSDGGPGCRWVGNEKGFAGETNWSFLRSNTVYPGYDKYPELTYGHSDGDQWVAAECDVSIRPGWFYHKSQDGQVRSVDNLMNLYYSSVGRNGTLLLNFPVDRRGKIPAIDSLTASKWRERLNQELAVNVLQNAKVKASNTRGCKFSAKNVIDGDYNTYWATKDGVEKASLTFKFNEATKINRLLLQEYIPLGQRVKSFNIEILVNNNWTPLSIDEETTTIGYKRILRFPRVEVNGFRINFTDSRGPLVINNIEAFNAPDFKAEERVETTQNGALPYKVLNVDEAEAKNMYDNNSHTDFSTSDKEILIDLGKEQKISNIIYMPVQFIPAEGLIDKYEVYSCDSMGKSRKLISKGEFSNIKNNPIAQTISFEPISTRFLLFKAAHTISDDENIRIAELAIK